jgi:indole-3-acetate monooxygenase
MTETANSLLARIQELAPDIAARAAEIEAGRRLPLDLVETLRSIGVFRMFAPRSHGGLEFDLQASLNVLSALGRIDGSVGWVSMIGSGSAMFAALASQEIYDQIYRDGPDVILAGSAQPSGTAEAVGDHWRVNGRWAFASGCQHADWIIAVCVMTRDGAPLPGPDGVGGPPMTRAVALPASEWQIEDTWNVAGLKGTGSHHVALTDRVVPAANFFDITNGAPCLPGPLYQTVRQFLPLLHGAIQVGIAEGALNELVALANTGRQQLRAPAPMRESEAFQSDLGRIAADLYAARATLEGQTAQHWRRALAGTLKNEACYVQSLRTAAWIAATCVRVVDACFALGGSSTLYDTSPLQRRLRDAHAAAQHAVAQQRNYIGAGKLLLDQAEEAA